MICDHSVLIVVVFAHLACFPACFGGKLDQLRERMDELTLDAYIIPHSDDHLSEFLPTADERLAFISGFTGSAGTAVITKNKAILWTDSRYTIQAPQELNLTHWEVMETGNHNPTISDWLKSNFDKGNRVSVDFKKINSAFYKSLKAVVKVVPDKTNLIDEIWKERPAYSKSPVTIYELAGENWNSKVERLRNEMMALEADSMVVTMLDEIAWLLNLRGTDAAHTPVFRSYLIINETDITLYIDEDKITPEVIDFLDGVTIQDYDDFWEGLRELVENECRTIIPSPGRDSHGVSYAVESAIPKRLRVQVISPIIPLRAYKPHSEVISAVKAQIKDAIALCEVMMILEEEVPAGILWDEYKVVRALDKYRSEQEHYQGTAFTTIVAYGENAALPHYNPTLTKSAIIDVEKPLLIDSGGQYLEGTIDTSRVLHFGRPSFFHKTVYTAILKGCIDLATTVFPENTTLDKLDFIARRHLLKIGRNYGHGTSHGTGVFLSVHEGFNGLFRPNLIHSQEPGFYKKNDYGMRLENLVVVIDSKVKSYTNSKLLAFVPITLVPYEEKLLNYEELDRSYIQWINRYHVRIRRLVGKEILRQNKHQLYMWLQNKTQPLTYTAQTLQKEDESDIETDLYLVE